MNCIIGQSGGPTSVINSSFAGCVRAAIDRGFSRIYGSLNGIEGIIDGNIVEIDKEIFLSKGIEDKLKKRPSSILGSCRYKLDEDCESAIYKKLFDFFAANEINSFIYIGGNDSMDTVVKLNKYMQLNQIDWINVVGVPKTIDNDLCEMDHSPGYASAAKYIATTLRTIRSDIDIYDIKSATIVEIMGRNAGWLAASSLLSEIGSSKNIVDLIYLGEMNYSKEEILQEVKDALEKSNNLLIVVSEGFMDRDKYFDGNNAQIHDKGFNHPIISGVGQRLKDYIHDNLSIKTRAIEMNIVQRTNQLISKTDSDEAFELGYKALELSMEMTNVVPVIRRLSSNPYKVEYASASAGEIANKEKLIPKAWLESRKVLEEKIVEYASPLILGELEQDFSNGFVQFVELEDFIK